MTIYTKTGDRGKTSLFGGRRLPKFDPQIEAYGSIDELTSFIGLVAEKNKKNKKLLNDIQKDLYKIMSFLSGAKIDSSFMEQRVIFFEKLIDEKTKKLPKIKNFILPQGTELSCWFHVLRSVCRRTERNIVKLLKNKDSSICHLESIIQYLNRLSDLFFVFARLCNKSGKDIIIK